MVKKMEKEKNIMKKVNYYLKGNIEMEWNGLENLKNIIIMEI